MPGHFYEKLRKQFRDTQRMPFMLDQTRKPLFPQMEKKYFEKSQNAEHCKKGTLWAF